MSATCLIPTLYFIVERWEHRIPLTKQVQYTLWQMSLTEPKNALIWHRCWRCPTYSGSGKECTYLFHLAFSTLDVLSPYFTVSPSWFISYKYTKNLFATLSSEAALKPLVKGRCFGGSADGRILLINVDLIWRCIGMLLNALSI